MSATQRWKAMIQVEHAQSEELRRAAPPSDHWGPYAQQFRADPDRADDPLVDLLLDKVQPQHTVIDAGAGGGRLALPLARRCRQVTAVEPSPSMGQVLLQQAQEYGIRNVSLVPARWEEARVQPADVVLCSHVVYTIQDIGPFVRKLTDHARRLTLIVLYNAPPQSQIYPLWPLVHHQERLPLPSLPEFQEVLKELGITYLLETLPPQPARGFDSREQALVLSQLGYGSCLRKGPIELSCLVGSVDGGGGSDGQGQIRGAVGTGTTGRAPATGPGWQKLSASDR